MKTSEVILADIASHNDNGKSVGHFFTVCDNYSEIFPECMISGGPIYQSHIPAHRLIQLPYDAIVGDNAIITKWHEYKNLRTLLKQSENKIIVFQQAALVTLILFLCLLKKPRCRLFIIAYDDNMVRSNLKKLVFKIAKKKINGIICPNEELGVKFSLPFCTVPDYIYIGNNENKSNRGDKKEYDFCLVGRLSPEKGAIEVVRELKNSQYRIIIAGRPQNELIKSSLIDEAKGASNITLILDYISIEQYNQIISSSKYALLNYQGEYSVRSSGVVYDMLFSGIPVVGQRCKALQFIDDNGCGFLYDNIGDLASLMAINHGQRDTYIKNIEIYRKGNSANIERLRSFIINA